MSESTSSTTTASTWGMTPQGFVPKRLAQILEDLNTNIANITLPAASGASGSTAAEKPFQNATDDSVLQQVLGVFAEGLAECWQAAYDGSVQFDPLKNSGAGQAGTIQLNAMLLKPGTATSLLLELTGTPGTMVPQGALVSARGSADGSTAPLFATLEAVVIGENGTAQVNAGCTAKGPFDPAPDTIVCIQTPYAGWRGVRNLATLAVGTEQESEAEARRRQQRSTALTSYRQIEAIQAAVAGVPGVIYCRAYQNSHTQPADARGIPFKEVAVVAEGGDSRAVAEALFLRLPTGQLGFGNTCEVFYDRQGLSYLICFSRPEEVAVAVELDISLTSRADFPDNGVELIKQAIVDYAQYGGEGNQDGFPPGSDIICSRLYTPANSVAGHKITRLEIAALPTEPAASPATRADNPDAAASQSSAPAATSEQSAVAAPAASPDAAATAAADQSAAASEPVFSTADIPIAWNQVGRFDVSRITVNLNDAEV